MAEQNLDPRPIPKTGLERIRYLIEAYRYHWEARSPELEKYRRMMGIRYGDQWEKDDIDTLDKANKPHLTFNHIGRLSDMIGGYERKHRKRVKALPIEDDDVEDTNIISQTLRWIDDVSEAEYEKSKSFDHCATMGEGILGFVEDFEEDVWKIQAESVFVHVPDREATDRVWRRSNWHSRRKWMSRQAIRNAWPEKLAAIDEMNPSYGWRKTEGDIEWQGPSMYEGYPTPSMGASHSSFAGDYDFDRLPDDKSGMNKHDTLGIFYKENVDKFLVVETWERVWVPTDVIVQVTSDGKELVIEEVPWELNERGMLVQQDDYLKKFVEGLSGDYKIINKKAPKIRITVWAGDVILEDGFTIFSRIPFVPYHWRVDHDGRKKIVQGFVERMVDAQIAYNKGKSQELHAINTSTGFVLLVNKQLVRGVKASTFEAALRNFNAVITVEAESMKEGTDYALIKPENFPYQIFQNLESLAKEIPILGGISEEALLGIQQQGDPSGWALEVKKESQEMTIATPFDNVKMANLELYGKIIWPALRNSGISMRLRKRMMSVNEQPNMQGLNALPVNMPLNQLTEKESTAMGISQKEIMDDPDRLVNDFSMMNVDFVLDEEQMTSTERQRIVAYLANLQKGGIPIPPLVFFEFMDEPVKDKILAILKQNAAPPGAPTGQPAQPNPVKQAPPQQGGQPGPRPPA